MAKEIFYVSGWCHSNIAEVHLRCAGAYAGTRCTCSRCNHPLVRVELELDEYMSV
jgi:hypothetical protein